LQRQPRLFGESLQHSAAALKKTKRSIPAPRALKNKQYHKVLTFVRTFCYTLTIVKAKQKQSKKTVVTKARGMKPVSVRAKIKHHAKKALVPHKANQFRPHLIRAHGIIAVLVIALTAQIVYGYATTGHFSVLSRTAHIVTSDLLNDTNKERVAEGLPSLNLNDKLSQAAFLKGKDMLTNNYWAHVSPSGVQPWKWFADVNYNYSYAGENLAKNYPSAEATVEAWMESATHRANILNGHYVDVGFAVVEGSLEGRETTLVVALYGSPVTVSAAQAASTQTAPFTAAAASSEGTNPLAYFGTALQSLSPVTIMILGLLGVVALVGVAAHHYRDKLPKAWKKSWRIHHGFYTFVGMLVLGVLIIVATGGGSI